jgi:hypothetical protein
MQAMSFNRNCSLAGLVMDSTYYTAEERYSLSNHG